MTLPPSERFGRFIVRKRYSCLAVLLLLILAAVSSTIQHVNKAGIPLDFTPQSIFMDNSPMMHRLKEIEGQFGREDNDVLIFLQGPSLNSAVGKTVIQDLHQAVEGIPNVQSVQSLWNAKKLLSSSGQLVVENIWDEDPFSSASSDPFLQGMLLSDDGQSTILRIRIDPALEKVRSIQPTIDAIRDQVSNIALPNDLELHLTGIPFVRTEVVDMMVEDELFYIPITALMFLVTVTLLFRGVLVSLAPLMSVMVAIVLSIAILLAGNITFNLLSILIPTIVLVIGIADGIHLLSRYREELLLDSHPEHSMGRTLRHMSTACFLTTVTTAAGFCSLMVAETTVIRDFGLHSAIAVVVTFFCVIAVVPLWLSFLSLKQVGKPPQSHSKSYQWFEWMDRFVRERTALVVVLTILLVGAAGYYGRTVKPNSSILEMYHSDHPTSIAIRNIENNLSGIVPIFIAVENSASDVLQPDLLKKMSLLEQELQQFELVKWTYSLPAQVQQIHYHLSGDSEIPNSRDLISQELFIAQFAGELPLDRVLSDDKSIARIIALCKDTDGQDFLQLKQSLEQTISKTFADTPDVRVDVTGDGLLASVGIDKLINDLLASLLLVFVIIGGILLLLLRDIRLTIVSCIPNVIPLIFTLATLRLIGADLQISNIISFTIAVGLAVDDTIHFIVRYQQERQSGQDHYTSISKSFHGAGHAILLTSLLLVSGFGVLATSQLTTTYHFGLLASVTLATAFLADLLFLPALMHINERWKRPS